MRVLFLVSVASFCVVLWLALALARRIRRDWEGRARPVSPPQAVEFFEAGEFRTPRSLRLNQNVSPQGARRSLEDFTSPSHQVQPDPIRTEVTSTPPRPSAGSASQASPATLDKHEARIGSHHLQGSQAVIINSRLQFVPAERPHLVDPAPHNTSPVEISSERKSPQPARSGSFRRVDLSHYNKDMGDLTDPYTQSSRVSGTAPRAAKNA